MKPSSENTLKICYLDAFSGISGDMTVGALVDAGANVERIDSCLRSLGTGARFEFEKTVRRGIAATKFKVFDCDSKAHRHLPQIITMIEDADLPDVAREDACSVFRRLGEAEAAVHQVPIDKVHFHEVGAVDSICDIVASCFALALLGIDRLWCSPVNVGTGTVQTEHGLLPVPAPATSRLLEGRPIYSRGPVAELTTPTGAAIVRALATSFGPVPCMTVTSCGYGAGDNDFLEQPNVLRAIIGQQIL